MSSLQINPYTLECKEGQRLEAWGAHVIVKAGTVETAGEFNLLEVAAPAGFATPLHIHYARDVAVYVLEGELTIYWGDDRKQATRGSYFFQPRGTPHGFRVTRDARVLYLAMPAGFDAFLVAACECPDGCDPMTTAARNKIEILGPLP